MKILFGLLAALSMTSAWAVLPESRLVCRSVHKQEGKSEYVIKYKTDRWLDRANREHYTTWVEVTQFDIVIIHFAPATWDLGRQYQYIEFKDEYNFGSIQYLPNGIGTFFMNGQVAIPIQCDNFLLNKLK